ncbi:UDP-N-acetylmuramate dehydrogenase [Oecophyllibacter saccharovorans]|uniref:UDP-N-acetylmuramate dehydrogenase n=1 Tax=Oecophyllibacter saccharovorans TaxID=2558360 RepID=UPI0011418963|nr:UDP-N-acetylmuramate dehydrogenase [Oecophyllibacter saccharovorans]QDH14670.1 UDP-N-acetylmuramate dehydrogenase [Oecophyllibacter saccharovorans]
MTAWSPATLPLRGRLKADAPLGPRSWFRTGGAADWLFVPADTEDLATLMRARPAEVPVTVLGACSNVIIRDGGVEGLVVRLAGGFADVAFDQDPETGQAAGVTVGAAMLDASLAERAAEAGLGGLEFLVGIPGSIGGAVRMNAGAHGGEMADVLDWVEVLLEDGRLERLKRAQLTMHYRHTALPENSIVVRARLAGRPEAPQEIQARLAAIRQTRETTQPVRARTGGSTFRNPEGHSAWKLIDAAGCRGLRIGDAQVSEKHCNFLLNLGQATSAELERLGETVRERVLTDSGVALHWEIKRLGRPSAPPTIPA